MRHILTIIIINAHATVELSTFTCKHFNQFRCDRRREWRLLYCPKCNAKIAITTTTTTNNCRMSLFSFCNRQRDKMRCFHSVGRNCSPEFLKFIKLKFLSEILWRFYFSVEHIFASRLSVSVSVSLFFAHRVFLQFLVSGI